MNMQEKLNQFIENVQGQFIEVSDRSNIYQCFDLADLWLIALGIPKSTIQHLYASDIFKKPNTITSDYFDIIPNTPDFIPQDGDVAVFDGQPGHVGIALSGGNLNNFRLFNQNYPLGTNAHIGQFNYNSPKLLGVLRPKNQGTQISVSSAQTAITDQTKYDFGGWIGTQEMGAIRSIANDLKRDLENCQNRPITIIAPTFTSKLANLFYSAAKALG